MPGNGSASKHDLNGGRSGGDGDEQIWAQRCKLYSYKTNAHNWVHLGVGKGSLLRSAHKDTVGFVFLEEELKVPMAKHPVQSISGLQLNSGTAKGCSWSTGMDAIQSQGRQWFTAKFATSEAALRFKDALEALMENPGADILPAKTADLDCVRAQSPLSLSAVPPALPGSRGGTANSPGLFEGGARRRADSNASSSPGSPMLEDALEEWQTLWPVTSSFSAHVPPLQAWLLYFERSLVRPERNVRETSTVYIGAYDSKELALTMSVRAMDAHCDQSIPWRVRSCWEQVEDRRKLVGDEGIIISVQNTSGEFNRVKLCRMDFNKEFQSSGRSEGDTLWDCEE